MFSVVLNTRIFIAVHNKVGSVFVYTSKEQRDLLCEAEIYWVLCESIRFNVFYAVNNIKTTRLLLPSIKCMVCILCQKHQFGLSCLNLSCVRLLSKRRSFLRTYDSIRRYAHSFTFDFHTIIRFTWKMSFTSITNHDEWVTPPRIFSYLLFTCAARFMHLFLAAKRTRIMIMYRIYIENSKALCCHQKSIQLINTSTWMLATKVKSQSIVYDMTRSVHFFCQKEK